MVDHEEAVRQSKQSGALDVYGTGARVNATYIDRTIEFIPVSRNDLNEFMRFDQLEFVVCSIGQFLLAGGLWIFIEKFLGPNFSWNTLTVLCFAATVVGMGLWFVGLKIREMKRGKIDLIFEKTPQT